MKTSRRYNAQRGFSMIEVMISIVVLGFGLLALAALQTSVIRSSSDTKAQTLALQLAKEKIEDIRAFETLAGYQAISTGSETTAISLGGVSFSRSWGVQRWAYNPDPLVNAFELLGTETGPTPVGFVENNEVKLVAVTVSWTDANGVTQTVGLEDGIGALSPADGSKVVLNNANTSQTRKPKVLIYDPGASSIPFATGNGSSTAASNPTPVIKGRTDAVAETLFDVLTYAGSSGVVQAQSRVETIVVGCTCSTANAPAATTARGFRPTYWNGYRYAPPVATTDKPTAGWTVPGGKNNTTESDRCDACCRDHRDPTGITGAKFDPWRATHNHYLVSGSTRTLANTGTYTEACRLIRVGGFFRVAADLRNDYFGLLETNNNGDTTNSIQKLRAYAPRVDTVNVSNDSVKNYQNFVLKYMDDRFSNNTVYTYNTPLATSTYESTFNLNNPVDNSGVPTSIAIKPTAAEKSSDSKWSHARGLYVDWIEPEALDVIKQAQIKCADKSTQILRNGCVLPFVPFTSVNLTELAYWKPKLTNTVAAALDQTVIQVANNPFVDSDALPTRGNVFKGGSPSINSEAFAMPTISESNAGVALREVAIDDDEANLLFDSQKYIISNGSGGGGIPVAVNLYNVTVPVGSEPSVTDSSGLGSCSPGIILSYIPYSCTLFPDANNNVFVKLAGYTKKRTVLVPNGCKANGDANMDVIVDYNVSTALNTTNTGTVTIQTASDDKTTGDSTVIVFTPVGASDNLRVNFSAPTYWCPSNYNQQANNNSTGLNCSRNTPQFNYTTSTLKQCTILTNGTVTVP